MTTEEIFDYIDRWNPTRDDLPTVGYANWMSFKDAITALIAERDALVTERAHWSKLTHYLRAKLAAAEECAEKAEADSKEICICAAVKATTGEVIRCHRHVDGFLALEARKLALSQTSEGQGFVTSRGRYVDRTEGRALQDAAGIPSADPDGYMPEGLCSEDLYYIDAAIAAQGKAGDAK